MPFPGAGGGGRETNPTSNGHSKPSNPGYSHVDGGAHPDADQDEEDIWATGQPPGRQTYGTFKQKRRSRKQQPPAANAADGEEPSSQSQSGESDADSGPDSDSEEAANTAGRHDGGRSRSGGQTPQTPVRKQAKDVDSDEEMRQVRRAIEAKHRSMMGMAPNGGGRSGGGQKRSRESGTYKTRKKARKTI